jgi:fumarylacetoacetase
VIDETHDAGLRSWIDSANDGRTDFPVQNLALGVFSTTDNPSPRIGVAIGDAVFDVRAALNAGLFDADALGSVRAFERDTLNSYMSLPAGSRRGLRRQLSAVLRTGTVVGDRARRLRESLLVPMHEATLSLPASIGDYTDFYASVHHATNVGRMFRPDNPLLPNYKYVPIGYHGRASSLVPSGTPVARPSGQTRSEGAATPSFGPTRSLDYECEIGAYVGPGNSLGTAIALADAESHLVGLCLVNDWSARDIQAWEYQPLGPFLAKNFATTLSPWIVTLDALAPFRSPAFERPPADPQPLPYLDDASNRAAGGIDITLEVFVRSARMRAANQPPHRLSTARFTDMYWTLAQLLTHHASNGCNLRPGDLLASGTVSGEAKDSRGCLLELTSRGAEPIALPSGETRRFLEDGDEVTMRAFCERVGFARIGFGECVGVVG